jgi:hypothetical protein
MRASIIAGSLLVGLTLVAPLSAQQVAAAVVVRSGPVAGRVVVGREYSTYRRPVTYRPVPARIVVVERVYVRHPGLAHRWERRGYHRMVLFYWDGRYYDRDLRRPGVREVVVYERSGRYLQECDGRDWSGQDDGPRHWPDDRDRD